MVKKKTILHDAFITAQVEFGLTKDDYKPFIKKMKKDITFLRLYDNYEYKLFMDNYLPLYSIEFMGFVRYIDIRDSRYNAGIKVLVTNMDTGVIKMYSSITDVCRDVGMSNKTIHTYIKEKSIQNEKVKHLNFKIATGSDFMKYIKQTR